MISNRKTVFAIFLAGIALPVGLLALDNISADQLSGKSQNAVSATNRNEVIFKKIRAAVAKNNLTSISSQCLHLELEEATSDGKIVVSVREVHTAQCGGDPNTSPRLFGVQANTQMNKMWSDAGSDDGEMKPIIVP